MAAARQQLFVRAALHNLPLLQHYNPIGPPDEILLWMLLSCLISYLNLSEIETPCFSGKSDSKMYRDAILFVLTERRSDDFNVDQYLDVMTAQ